MSGGITIVSLWTQRVSQLAYFEFVPSATHVYRAYPTSGVLKWDLFTKGQRRGDVFVERALVIKLKNGFFCVVKGEYSYSAHR